METIILYLGYLFQSSHLRSKDFLDVNKFPQAKFVSISYQEGTNGKAILKGKLTLHGVTKDLGPASAELDLIFNFEGIKQ